MRWARQADICPGTVRVAGSGVILGVRLDAADAGILAAAAARAGLSPVHVTDLEQGLGAICTVKPDLVVTRLSRLEIDASEFIEAVLGAKRTETLPVLFLDDAAEEPALFDPEQSAFMRIRAILRRERPSVLRDTREEYGFILHEAEFRLSFGANSHDLSKSELCVIGPFFDSPGTVFDRLSLERLAFGTSNYASGNRQIDFYVNRLRRGVKRSLGYDPLRSIRGRGYTLTVP